MYMSIWLIEPSASNHQGSPAVYLNESNSTLFQYKIQLGFYFESTTDGDGNAVDFE